MKIKHPLHSKMIPSRPWKSNDNRNDNTLKMITQNMYKGNDNVKHHFYIIIFPCTYFVLSYMLSFLGCYHLCYHLLLSFFTVSKCYHFPLYIFFNIIYVIIYVIIWCYHFLLSFPPFFLFPENVTHSNKTPFLTLFYYLLRKSQLTPQIL